MSLEEAIIVAATNGDMATVREHLAAMHPQDHSRILSACEWIRDEDLRMRWENERDDARRPISDAACAATGGIHGDRRPCVKPLGHYPHNDGMGCSWVSEGDVEAWVPSADRLARALHDADCGCGTYDEVEDPRYITAARAALTALEQTEAPSGEGPSR